jgi:hypothetical protein
MKTPGEGDTVQSYSMVRQHSYKHSRAHCFYFGSLGLDREPIRKKKMAKRDVIFQILDTNVYKKTNSFKKKYTVVLPTPLKKIYFVARQATRRSQV